jgi:hypothetical protein
MKQLFKKWQLQFPIGKLNLSDPIVFARWLRRICRHKWVVYNKKPFAGPQAVLAYICRYTHRVAISNSRLKVLDTKNKTVTFSYKDYAHNNQIRLMTLGLTEFLRRFCLHILPPRFVKIRHYGLFSNRDRPTRIAQARALLAQAPSLPELPFDNLLVIQPSKAPALLCPHCGHRSLILIRVINRSKCLPFWDTS